MTGIFRGAWAGSGFRSRGWARGVLSLLTKVVKVPGYWNPNFFHHETGGSGGRHAAQLRPILIRSPILRSLIEVNKVSLPVASALKGQASSDRTPYARVSLVFRGFS